MQYDTIVLDIDGTILNDELEVTQKVIDGIEELKNSGKTVIICTGRMLSSAQKIIAKYFSSRFPIIGYNGSVIVLPESNEEIFHEYIEDEAAIDIIKYLREINCHRQIYIDDKIITEEDNEKIKKYSIHSGMDYTVVDDLVEAIKKDGKVDKILAIGNGDFLSKVEKGSVERFSEKANIFKSFSTYLDYIPKKTNKGIAILELLKHLNLEPERTIMIGDGDNDVFAFEVVGYSIAMGNATEKLKKAASHSLEKTNNEDGVFHALCHVFPELHYSNCV
jgi:Cof subfamily protein (haloacid dehalogenase superfamily)